ncbi:LysR family transcriptional regulator [Sinirhodobacter populi]|uniref:LysR family transcriptional regulator n=2 Tax=Paenirhodobacter populi TaxID=2306993 RepID=A0A443K560_9RHOB|nr:LysR family transcriptional regulator [Sinirhodobacter populi]
MASSHRFSRIRDQPEASCKPRRTLTAARITAGMSAPQWGQVRMKPDLRSLEIFYWVAEFGSFRRAAARLNTSQPAVSQRIAALEADFGTPLIVRGPRKASLTPKGRELREFAERFLRLSDELAMAFAAPNSHSGVIRLGLAETLVHTWLPVFIERAHNLFPNVTLDIEVDVSSHMVPALVDGQVDLAFLIGPVQRPSILDFPLCSYPLAFVARPDLPLGPPDARGLIPREAIARTAVITFPTETMPYQTVRDLLGQGGDVRPRLYSNSSLSSIVRMTLDGIGVSVIPPAVIGPHLEKGELVLLKTDMELPRLSFVAAIQAGPDRALLEALARLAQEVAAEQDLR